MILAEWLIKRASRFPTDDPSQITTINLQGNRLTTLPLDSHARAQLSTELSKLNLKELKAKALEEVRVTP